MTDDLAYVKAMERIASTTGDPVERRVALAEAKQTLASIERRKGDRLREQRRQLALSTGRGREVAGGASRNSAARLTKAGVELRWLGA